MKASVEDIIRTKEYFQLTPDELSLVQEYASNVEEYDEMRWFLQNVNDAFQSQKINASPGLKKRVMEHLNKSDKKVVTVPGGARRFLFPQGASIFQMPGFQLAAAAAVVIGVFIAIGNPLEDNDTVAVNDKITGEQEPTVIGGETDAIILADSTSPNGSGDATILEVPKEMPIGVSEKNIQDPAGESESIENVIVGDDSDELSENDRHDELGNGNPKTDGGVDGKVTTNSNSPLRQVVDGEQLAAQDDKKNQEGYAGGTTVTGTIGGVAKESSKADDDSRIVFSSERKKDEDKGESSVNQPIQDISMEDKEREKVVDEVVVSTMDSESLDAKGEKGKDANLKSRTESLEEAPSGGTSGPTDYVAPVNQSIGLCKELKALFYTVK